MKKLNELSLYLIAMLFVFASCSSDDGGDDMTTDMEEPAGPTENIVEIATAQGFTSLAAALTRAGLVDDLEADGTFTVFAPTNAAFSALLAAIGQTSVDDVPVPILTDILLYHVLGDTVFSSAIAPGTATTLEGTTVTLATDGGVTVNGANVTTADVEATNGVIHIIDAVLVPADHGAFVNTVLEPAYFSVNFTTLIEAAVKADVVDDLLAADALTIFAPNNAAFTAAGVTVADVDAEDLGDILGYHVVGAKVLEAGIPSRALTLQEDSIFFSIVDGEGAFINGSTEIIATDIESGTGVVHVIDDVLMPSGGDIVDVAGDLSDFSSLVAALTRTADEEASPSNLVSALQGTGPFTVFAPTNAAFTALINSNEAWTELDDIPIETLHSVLTYHVVGARAFDVDLADAVGNDNELGTLNGADLTFDLTDLEINDGVSITATNVLATNGVIHVIDEVMLPPAEPEE